MKSEFVLAINEITEVRALPREVILEALRTALVSAYRRDVSVSSAQRVEATIDINTGSVTLLVEKEAVQSVQNQRTEIALDEARQIDPEVQLGDTLMVPVADTTQRFGRIAAQTAKQVILQKIREAERDSLYDEFVEREGDLISGTVQSVGPQGVTISLGRAEALLPRAHMMPGERYRPHDKVRTYLLEVKKGTRGPQIIVSRSHRNMLRRLLEYEVPEIYNGQVEIKNIAREAGQRSKVAVAALQEGVDPVGACVGMRGIRIQNIVRELNEEKIDVIEWSQDAATFITKALSPARVTGVYLDEYADSGKGGMGTATVIVLDDQLSLAIGREGQNARLAAKLTGWRIDIKSVTEAAAEALQNTGSAALASLHEKNAGLVEEIQRLMAKREAGRPLMPEEFQTVTQYARMAEQAQLEERRSANKKHQEHVQTVRATLPPRAFDLNLEHLDLPAAQIRALAARFESVGDLMLYLILDESRIQKALKRAQEQDDDGLEDVKAAVEFALEKMLDEPAPPEAEAVEVIAGPEEPVAAATAVLPDLPLAEEAALEEEVLPAVAEPDVEEEPEPVRPPVRVEKAEPAPVQTISVAESFAVVDDDEVLDSLGGRGPKKKKGKSQSRELVYDESLGKTVARRKRKGSRRSSSFYDFDDEEI